ncbi:hypothetical protein H6F98_09095 [Microcoleus sp. FACHB-SPT15]|uniref:HEPN domain-containing protein n=1 Tax=Microcoleus sp. FACHB-SPT15 TaxID=2692830 RepID=UPI0017840172|nr:HEPN domain-containing protein [Microcoleus sp. FACHB-SPT15]MBD1805602.1 hypothetical protein [Microcoleus sp. FACHB-SPT15]
MLDENIICNFLSKSIEQLKGILPSNLHQWSMVVLQRIDNGYQLGHSDKPDFLSILRYEQVRKHLSSWDEFSRIIDIDIRYQKIKQEHTERFNGGVSYWLETNYVVESIFREYIGQLNQLKYEEKWAHQIARNLLRSLNEEILESVCYSVVRGLECDFECQTLSKDIQLRKLTDDEICRLIDLQGALLQDDALPINPCVLEQRFMIPVYQMQEPDINTAAKNFNEIITALRLLKEGCVEIQNTYMRSERPGQLRAIGGSIGSINKHYPISQTYTLFESDIPALKEILTAIKFGRIPVPLQTAVDRVNFAAERNRPDDQLLDLLIAMEAIFGDSQGAIGYKIRLRCAVFVENDYEERSRISKLINDAYSRRSALVHGGKSKSMGTLKLTTDEIVKKLLVLIRRSINLIIKRLLSGENVPNGQEFDKMLLQQA